MITNVACAQSSPMPGMNMETVSCDASPPTAGATMAGPPMATLKNCATGATVAGPQAMSLVAGTANHYAASFMVAQGIQYCASVSVIWNVTITDQASCNCA